MVKDTYQKLYIDILFLKGSLIGRLTEETMSALTILAEECELLNDSKYRSYITQVEKALKSFEYTSEWADLISALGKLNKVRYIVVVNSVDLSGILSLRCMEKLLLSTRK